MSAIAKIVAFFRAGYPEAAPLTGYAPPLALLRRRLGDDEIPAVVDDLVARGDVRTEFLDIGATIMRMTHELPTAEDIDRVAQHFNAVRRSHGGHRAP